MFRKLRRKIVRFAVVSGAGAATNYFLDPDRGVERREQAKAKASSLLKRGGAAPATDWPASATNGFDPPATVVSTTVTAATAGDIVNGTTPIDLLVVEERTTTRP